MEFQIEVNLAGGASAEYSALNVAMEARGFKTVDGEGKSLRIGEYKLSRFAGQLSKDMVEKAAREVGGSVAKELGREWKVRTEAL